MLLIKIFPFFREDLICIVKQLFTRSLITSLKLPRTLITYVTLREEQMQLITGIQFWLWNSTER